MREELHSLCIHPASTARNFVYPRVCCCTGLSKRPSATGDLTEKLFRQLVTSAGSNRGKENCTDSSLRITHSSPRKSGIEAQIERKHEVAQPWQGLCQNAQSQGGELRCDHRLNDERGKRCVSSRPRERASARGKTNRRTDPSDRDGSSTSCRVVCRGKNPQARNMVESLSSWIVVFAAKSAHQKGLVSTYLTYL